MDQPTCSVCEVALPDGAAALSEHLNSTTHRLALYQDFYTTNRESMLRGKKGIEISAVPDQSSSLSPIEEHNGKMTMFLDSGCCGSAAIQIHNTNADMAVMLHLVEPLHPCPSIRLSDTRDVVKRRRFIRIQPDAKYQILFQTLPGSNGVIEMPVVFQFAEEHSSDAFCILRILCVQYLDNISIKTLATLPVVNAVIDKNMLYPPRAGTYIRGFPLNRGLIPDSYTWACYYPEILRNLVALKFNHKRIEDMRMMVENNKMRVLMKKGLQQSNYYDWFKAQLWIEEMEQERLLQSLHQRNVLLKKSSYPDLLQLEVPGVTENRPALKTGYTIFFRHAGEASPIYEGIIHLITGETVFVGLAADFVAAFRNGTRMDVQFWFNRSPYIRSHKALQLSHHIKHLLFPCQPLTRCPMAIKSLKYYDPCISQNVLQQQAVKAIVYKFSAPAPYVLFGPPGTGKTLTIVEAIKQVYKLNSHCRILISAPTNSACDVVTERLLHHIPVNVIRRIYADSRDEAAIPDILLPVSNVSGGIIYMPSTKVLEKYKIIVTTFLTAAKVLPLFTEAAKISRVFSHIFLDECGHGTEPEALIPLLGLGETVVLAGDHRQLGPLVFSKICQTNNMFFTNNGLDQSLLERFMNLDLYKPGPDGRYQSRFVTKLLDNYRSHGAILKIPNELFYDSQLRVRGDPTLTHSLLSQPILPNKAVPLVFYGVNGKDAKEGNNPSYFNYHEVSIVVRYVRELLNIMKLRPKDIGIVVPYKAQTQKIRDALSEELVDQTGDLLVGSPEQFQGNERLVIIVSTVRASAELLYNDVFQQLGFLCNAKRFNVAVTRAQALLIVVGCPWLLERDLQWGALLKFCIEKGCYTGCQYSTFQDAEVDDVGRAMNLLQIQELQHKKKSRGRKKNGNETNEGFHDDFQEIRTNRTRKGDR